MKTSELVLATIALVAPAVGCGDDSNPGGSGDESTGSTGDATSTTTTGADDSTTAVATSGNEGGESSSSGEPPPVEVTVEGRVIDFVVEAPIPDSEISIYDDPGITAMADGMGQFSIGTFEADTTALFVLAPSMDYWGAVVPVEIGSDPLQEDVELTQISNAIVDQQIMFLEAQMPAPPDLDQAIIIVRLRQNTAVDEGPTLIEMTPPPAPDTFYAPDAAGAPILNSSSIEFNILPVVVYYNIPGSDPGTYTFTATHPTRDCTIVYPDLPTIGQHMTLVEVECLPP